MIIIFRGVVHDRDTRVNKKPMITNARPTVRGERLQKTPLPPISSTAEFRYIATRAPFLPTKKPERVDETDRSVRSEITATNVSCARLWFLRANPTAAAQTRYGKNIENRPAVTFVYVRRARLLRRSCDRLPREQRCRVVAIDDGITTTNGEPRSWFYRKFGAIIATDRSAACSGIV